MKSYFINIACSIFLFFSIISCEKADEVMKPYANVQKTTGATGYTVHATVRKLDSLSVNVYNYELSFWVTTNIDSLIALELPEELLLKGFLISGSDTIKTDILLKEGSVITRRIQPYQDPVAMKGIFSVPSGYHGKPIECNATVIEQKYNLRKVHVAGTGFADVTGKAFIPWGVNYTNTDQLPLVDYDWYNDSVWEIIKQDIREMKLMNVNIIRIHLQYNRFMVAPNTPNENALTRLKELVDFAGMYGLYVDITGLGCYFKSDTPPWYDAMNEADRWATQSVFWGAIAAKVKDCDNVFAYNLMNEPVVPYKKTDEWLPGAPFAGYNFVQNLTREPAGRSWDVVTHQWIATLLPAIRKYDSETLVTVGFIGLGVVARFNDLLDYNSAHIYPESGKIPEAIQFVVNNQTEKPLVIEETGPLGAGFDDMKLFITSTEDLTAGYLSHYHGQPIHELQHIPTLQAAIQKEWYIIFTRELNPNYNKPVY